VAELRGRSGSRRLGLRLGCRLQRRRTIDVVEMEIEVETRRLGGRVDARGQVVGCLGKARRRCGERGGPGGGCANGFCSG
jgi:hypothetical protein